MPTAPKDPNPPKPPKATPDGPPEIEEAARQEAEYPEDQTDEG